jgi:hypothetical protein
VGWSDMKNNGWFKELRQETAGEHTGYWTRGHKLNVFFALLVMSLILGAGIGISVTQRYGYNGTNYVNMDVTYIRNSNGKIYDATEANIQNAIWDLNSTSGGWVQVPRCNITFTTTLLVTNGIWLRGSGNGTVFYLGNAVNKTMIMNYSVNSKNIRLSDFKMNGNSINQDPWCSAVLYNQKFGIHFRYVSNLTIDNLIIENTMSAGILIRQSSDVTITNTIIYRPGQHLQLDSIRTYGYHAKGIALYNCSRTIVSNCEIIDAYSSGIAVENDPTSTSVYYYGRNFIIDNVIVYNCFNGVWLEQARDGIISNCYFYDITKFGAYGSGVGSRGLTIDTCVNISVNHVFIEKVGNSSDNIGDGILGIAKNLILDDCTIINSFGDGIEVGRYNTIVRNCNVFDSSLIGIRVYTYGNYSVQVIGCFVNNSGHQGMAIGGVASKDNPFIKACKISDNIIKTTGNGDSAIQCPCFNFSITGNIISNSAGFGIRMVEGVRFGVISGNTINKCVEDCIKLDNTVVTFSVGNVSITGNYLSAGSDGIELNDAQNVTVSSNNIKECTRGVVEVGTADYNHIGLNNCLGCTTPYTIVGTHDTLSSNWDAVFTMFNLFKGNWNATRNLVLAKSADWNASGTNTLQPFASSWNATRSLLLSLSPFWNTTRAVVLAKSDTWNATSALVSAKSAAWNLSGNGYNVTYITNSKGNYWTATGANAQLAVNDLGNLTGWVDFNKQFINLTTALKLGSYCEIRNFNFGLVNNANTSVINNYNIVTGNTGIYIHDGYINGNGANQPIWWGVTSLKNRYCHGINFTRVINSQIDHVVINKAHSSGILWYLGNNASVSYCDIYNSGIGYESQNYQHWWAKGIFFDAVNYSTISNCLIDGAFSGGIVVETTSLTATYSTMCHDVIVSNCIARNTEVGFYIEQARKITLDSCVATDCDRYKVYHAATGFNIISPSYDNLITGCTATYSGTTNHTYGDNFLISGNNNTLIGCHSEYSYKTGYAAYGANHNFIGCTSKREYSYGYNLEAYNITIDGGWIEAAGAAVSILYDSPVRTLNKHGSVHGVTISYGAGVAINVYSDNVTVSDNTIYTPGTYGIQANNVKHTTIQNNRIEKATNGCIYLSGCNKGIISGNYIYGGANWGYAIRLSSTKRFNIYGNTIEQSAANTPDYAITESATADYNFIHDNYLNMTTATAKITRTGANTIVTGNFGNYSIVLPTAMPATPVAGQMYCNVTTGDIAIYSGAAWIWTHG